METLTEKADIYVSHSSIAESLRCPFSHYAKYPLGVRAGQGFLPARGNVLHAGILDGVLSGNGTYEAALSAAANHPDWAVVVAEGEGAQLVCMAVLLASTDVFGRLRDQANVLVSEQKMTRDELRGDIRVRYTVKCDGVLSEERPYVLELKTTRSYINRQYWDKAAISNQNWFYQDELRTHHGYNVESLAWQVVKMPDQKKYSWAEFDGTSQEYIDRIAGLMTKRTDVWFPYVHFEYDKQKALANRADVCYHVDRMVADYVRTRDTGLLPGRNTNACFDFGRRCEMYTVCHEGDSFDNSELFQLRRDR